MAKLGSFGKEIKKGEGEVGYLPGDSFDWCGQELRLRHVSQVSEVPLIALMGQSDMDQESPEGMRALMDFFTAVIYPDDARKFTTLAVQHGAGGPEMAELLAVIVPALYNRPTEGLSASVDGQPSTTPSSPVASSSTTPMPTFQAPHLEQPRAVEQPRAAHSSLMRDPHHGTVFEPVDGIMNELQRHSVLS